MSTPTLSRKRATPQEKYLATNSTAAAFTYSAGGRTTLDVTTIVMKDGMRGIRLTPYGAGSDNQTFDFRVWLVRRPTGTTGSIAELALYGAGSATLSAAVGSATDLLGTSERFVDTCTWTPATTATTPKGIGSLVEANNGLGTSYVYSPANDTPAILSIPDLDGAPEVLIDFDMTGATAANFLIEQTP